jgi:hypothetical protein
MRKQSILYKTLVRALSLKRPHKGRCVGEFTDWLCNKVYEHMPHLDMLFDEAGNIHIDARASTAHRTLFVAHVDTVHRDDGANKFIKAHGKWFAKDAPLGADDGAGCAMLMHLLCSGVPGYYIFTQGEECGGIGAKHLADHHKDLLRQFDRAIAFDRRGVDSVITHQGYGRCCSDEFADALADALNEDLRLMYLPDNTGVYTDTAEFTDLIPECTNISVGYDREHSDKESLDIYHFMALAERVVQIAWDNLPTKRDPSVVEPEPDYSYAYYKSTWAKQVSTTSVNSSFFDEVRGGQPWQDDADEDVKEAIYDAMAGYPGWLVELICESVYPEDTELARRYIKKSKLREEKVLKEHLDMLATYGADAVLASLFDASYLEA